MEPFFFFFLFFGTVLIIWMFFIEPRLFQINRYEVAVQKWLDHPIRILHLSDIHFAAPDRTLARFFDRLAEETYHFVFITGDIMDCEEGIPTCVENLKKLRASHGVFAVFGNHDYFNYQFWDIFFHNFPGQGRPLEANRSDLLKEALEDAGIRVLVNETVPVFVDGVPILVHGLDDPTTGRANVREAMQNFDRGKINILLAHTVDVFLDIGENEIDLSFSGHSHGGQIRLPVIGPLITHTMIGRQYAAGVLHHKGAVCSISRGVKASRFFFGRLLCPPEAIAITIRPNLHTRQA